MHLDRFLADAKAQTNRLVGQSRSYQFEYLLFTIGQRVVALLDARLTAMVSLHLLGLRNRFLQCVEQLTALERLFQKIDGAALHGLNCRWNVAIAGNEDDWQRNTAARELDLQIEPRQSGHAHIKQQAAVYAGPAGGEKVLRPFKLGHVPRLVCEHLAQQSANLGIILDDENGYRGYFGYH